ncbi:hypothetical protein EHS25_009256 [Saitozyma podzolica]|uniref:NAD(+) kinase n=1 Tax=Saitozyma podzolica TaxID=1890683 RepID=A0A427YLE0_9TREE|nr:hypothetical protein EHS25_009256 [Saitozyma podzolica]
MSNISTSHPPSSSPITPRQDPASSPYTLEHHCYPSDSLSHLHVDLGAPRDSPADLLHLSRSIPPPPRSAESPRTTQSFPPRPSSVHRRQSSYLRKLELNAELERKQFGLTDVCVSTSPGPDTDLTDAITIDLSLTPTPRAATMSYATTHHESGGSLAAPQPPIARTQTPAMNVPSSRSRNPVPPSPLSKVSSPSDEPTAFPEPSPTTQLSPPSLHHAQTSPCFIHSHLDRHGSLQDWLAHKTNTSDQNGNGPSKPKQRAPEPKQFTANRHSHSPHHAPHHRHHTSATSSGPSSQPATPRREPSGSGYESDKSSANGHQSLSGSAVLDGDFLEDEEEGGSLTKQLAETAQGVREMSKELGRTRVRSRIQHVLVVTKARDNRLIQLTRELALYLMQKRPVSSPDGRNSDRGMVVYVDAQLRHSKRFDAAGIQRDYPDLFQPIHRRRSSSSASLTAISAFPSTSSMSDFSRRPRDEGQLRYWTSEMCSNSPHLFDFVVTLGGDGTVLFTSWLL